VANRPRRAVPTKIFLSEWRKVKGYSQSGLARAARVSRQTVITIESGKGGIPHPATILSLSQALGIREFELFMAPEDRNEKPHVE